MCSKACRSPSSPARRWPSSAATARARPPRSRQSWTWCARAVTWNGEDITALPPSRIVRAGIGYVPEERRIFPNLSVYENLKMARLTADGGRRTDAHLAPGVELFPPLADRLANKGKTLSGG